MSTKMEEHSDPVSEKISLDNIEKSAIESTHTLAHVPSSESTISTATATPSSTPSTNDERTKSDSLDTPEKSEKPKKTDNGIDENGKIVYYPEGGFGWLVVLASFVVNMLAFGTMLVYGVFMEYYLRSDYFHGAVASQLSWVGSLSASFMFVTGPFMSPMIRFMGFRTVTAMGIILSATALILASFSKELWHLYLTQGILAGLGNGIIFSTSISVASQYFNKRRGLANGIAVAGSGLGGLVLSPLVRYLITAVGVQWTTRILGIVALVGMFAVFPFIRPRIHLVKTGPIFDFSVFNVPGFKTLMGCAIIVTFGYMIPVFLLPSYATNIVKLPATTGANMISIYSGINAVSRIGLGVAADRWGRMNTLFACCFLAGLSCLLVWVFATNLTTLIAFVVLYGLNGGGFVSIFPVVVAEVVSVERLASALPILYFGNVPGNLLGTPIATAIIKAQNGSYTGAIIFAGLMPVIAALLVLVLRYQYEKRIFAVV